MKTIEPTSNTLKHVNKIPFSKELGETAQSIASNATQSLEDGKMSSIEAAGHISMAALLSGVSDGSIPPLKAYGFLKTLAEKKTPAPVQKIESHTEIDMRTILFDAVNKNPTALEDVVAISIAAREKVRVKIKADDNRLELTPPPKATAPIAGSPEASASWDEIDDQNESLPEPLTQQSLEEYSLNLRELGITKSNVQVSPNKGWEPGSTPPEIAKLQNRGD